MSLLDTSKVSMDIAGDVLTLTLGDSSCKVKLPRGERGPPGRDGISIRGEKGEKGDKGECGLAGRDSIVPGPQGPPGAEGQRGGMPKFSVGQVVVGETASIVQSGSDEQPVLNFTIPRGHQGIAGQRGRDGKDGQHEFIQVRSMGHCPRFHSEFLATHIICDGVIDLPEMTESDVGAWTVLKTFDRLTVTGLMEGTGMVLDKTSRKFVVIPYGDKFKFSAF